MEMSIEFTPADGEWDLYARMGRVNQRRVMRIVSSGMQEVVFKGKGKGREAGMPGDVSGLVAI
jgi:hypothetical protein